MQLTFSGYQLNERLVNFPALVCLGTNIPGFSYAQFGSKTGADLMFTDAGGYQQLPYEIDEWNTNGTSYVWVQVPALAGPTDSIWAYWGSVVATNPPAYATNGSVWDGHAAVYHLRESDFPFADGTTRSPLLTGDLPASSSGHIGRGQSFSTAHVDYLRTSNTVANHGGIFTVSAWVNVTSNKERKAIISTRGEVGATNGFTLCVNNYATTDGALVFLSGDSASYTSVACTDSNAVSFGQWHQVAASADSLRGIIHLYVDGVEKSLNRSEFDYGGHMAASAPVYIAKAATTNAANANACYFAGGMDEVRIETEARTANWIKASHLTVASNNLFCAYDTVTRGKPAISGSLAGQSMILNWPASAVGYALYTTTNLASANGWSLVTNTPVLVNSNGITQWQISLPWGTHAARFFGLKSP
jgi:hypothetical protein